MIEDIKIKDFALIHELSLDLKKGFTLLTGETGAGKSILIGAVSFLLGGKISLDVIPQGCHESIVSGTILIDEKQIDAKKWLEEKGISYENNRVLLRRIVKDTGKTASWIESVPVTRNDLSEFTSFFVDIHGQHEHQSLMKVSEHRKFLDSYANIEDKVAIFSQNYHKLVEKRNYFTQINTSESQKNQRIDYLNFAINEINEAQLKKDEDILLETEESKLSQYEKLFEYVDNINAAFKGDSYDLISNTKKLRSLAEYAATIDSQFEPLSERIESLFYEISDLAQEIALYQNGLSFDPERLNYIQERLALIFKLKKKYAPESNSLEEIFLFKEKAEIELEQLSNGEKNKDELIKEIKQLEVTLYNLGNEISNLRYEAAEKMSIAVEDVLSYLGMENAKFLVSITEKDSDDLVQKAGPFGFNNIEFLISTNKGSPLKPLAKIASGGELSRVMLALKTVLSETDSVDTLIFDEIDTGIGGEVSIAVGAHLKKLAEFKQVFCITHLASIAVYADNHIKIKKNSDLFTTETSVKELDEEQRVEEIARMLAGDAINQAAIEHAKSLLSKYGGIK